MKWFLSFVLSILLCLASNTSQAKECLEEHAVNTDNLYRVGECSKDGAYTATSASMIGWGIALFVAIAIICGTLHQSKAKSTASTTSTTDST
jgi:hypothetical protein